MNITDEMVDAYLISMPVGWSGHLDEVRAGLAAVAPLIAAQALRDAAGYLAITHRHLNLHDRMGANLSCDGCRILRAIER